MSTPIPGYLPLPPFPSPRPLPHSFPLPYPPLFPPFPPSPLVLLLPSERRKAREAGNGRGGGGEKQKEGGRGWGGSRLPLASELQFIVVPLPPPLLFAFLRFLIISFLCALVSYPSSPSMSCPIPHSPLVYINVRPHAYFFLSSPHPLFSCISVILLTPSYFSSSSSPSSSLMCVLPSLLLKSLVLLHFCLSCVSWGWVYCFVLRFCVFVCGFPLLFEGGSITFALVLVRFSLLLLWFWLGFHYFCFGFG
jgi:hypothetical protein